jgi:small nuclear ribonucleoprotein
MIRNSFKKVFSLPSAMSLPLDVLEKAVNQKLLLLLKDGRHIEGKLLGYDEYMNLVLDEVEESKEETKRRLGRIILRGSNVVSISFL